MLGNPSLKYYSVHATPRGVNDARPTALRIINDEIWRVNGPINLS